MELAKLFTLLLLVVLLFLPLINAQEQNENEITHEEIYNHLDWWSKIRFNLDHHGWLMFSAEGDARHCGRDIPSECSPPREWCGMPHCTVQFTVPANSHKTFTRYCSSCSGMFCGKNRNKLCHGGRAMFFRTTQSGWTYLFVDEISRSRTIYNTANEEKTYAYETYCCECSAPKCSGQECSPEGKRRNYVCRSPKDIWSNYCKDGEWIDKYYRTCSYRCESGSCVDCQEGNWQDLYCKNGDIWGDHCEDGEWEDKKKEDCGSRSCSNARCVQGCEPNCQGKECGDDGCGESCGTCLGGETCQNYQCISSSQCGNGQCESGENYINCCTDCGCEGGLVCENNNCVEPPPEEYCGDGICNNNEGEYSCCIDCPCTSQNEVCDQREQKCVLIPPQEECGDNVINQGEQCDGSNLGDSTCYSLGYESGTLTCDSSCMFDASNCIVDPENPPGEGESEESSGFCISFADDIVGSITNSDDCQLNTIIFFIVILVALLVISRLAK